MEASTSVLVWFSTNTYDGTTEVVNLCYGGRPHPRDIYKTVAPEPKDVKWLPQTMYDAIWVLYEFSSPDDKAAFLASPPASFDQALIRPDKDQAFYDHWTQ